MSARLPIEITPERWRYTTEYLRQVFGAQDPLLDQLLVDAKAAGLPDIAVSADVGHLLQLLASLTPGRLVLELGTLGGYSGIWLARGISGRLVTVEADPAHADFAEQQFLRAGLADRVEVLRGPALTVLGALQKTWAPGSVDMVFIDADKLEYPEYFEGVRGLLAPGGLFVADNVLGTSRWWIDHEDHPMRQAADRLNRTVAADPEFLAVGLPLREGLLVAQKRR